MIIQAALLDFDGTLVTEDLLDILCGLVGKEELSAKINEEFHNGEIGGVESLIQRLDLLQALSLEDVNNKLRENSYLREGTTELLEYFKERGIKTILNSGQIIPVLQFYQSLLSVDYIVGTHPEIRDGSIYGISPEHPIERGFKLKGCRAILDELGIPKEHVIALGDSPSDRKAFDYSALSIAVAPKGGIEEYADHVIQQDLREAIPIIKRNL
tara:strand:- start:7842 stop:8480 length:639 start_codon:yes stop_codon:yes gene_type:complete